MGLIITLQNRDIKSHGKKVLEKSDANPLLQNVVIRGKRGIFLNKHFQKGGKEASDWHRFAIRFFEGKLGSKIRFLQWVLYIGRNSILTAYILGDDNLSK